MNQKKIINQLPKKECPKKENSWKKRLEEYSVDLDCAQGIHTKEALKEFISQLLLSERQKSKEELESEIIRVIDEYFVWLIHIPDPQATRENIKNKIRIAINPEKYSDNNQLKS